jgi:hypothetical protein
MSLRLQDRRALVTGGSRGLGRHAVNRMRLVALAGVVAALPIVSWAQTAPSCPIGSGVLTSAALGTPVMREGQGLGGVNLGSSAAEVQRAWGLPGECFPAQRGYAYHYQLSDDGGQTSLLIVVMMHQDRVEQILATLLPHSGGRGPALRTGRGVAILAAADDVRRIYGPQTLESQNALGYVAEGVAFQISRGVVGSIMIFAPGSVPPGWRRA